MRRILSGVAGIAVAIAGFASPAAGDVKPGGFMSPNVTWVAHLPVDSPAVSARVIRVGRQTRLYVAGVKGLTIWDVTNPALPTPLGTTPLPNWQNEDMEVSADGSVAIVANDMDGVSYLVDTSDPRVPKVKGLIAAVEHTITCADAMCRYAYGRLGAIYDLRDRAKPRQVEDATWQPATVKLQQRAHDLYRDETGLLFADTMPRLVLDPRRDPLHPRLVATGAASKEDKVAYQHNSVRPRASDWRPRRAGDTSAALRPGELLIANGETNFAPQCNSGSGPISTWGLRNFDKGAQLEVLDVYRPVNGNWTNGNPAANVGLGCSGHWFTERGGVVAAGWFEHGVRFLTVAPATGKIREVGFFQPGPGSASAAYWVNDEYVYAVDYERGIDILRFDRSAPAATPAQIRASWLSTDRVSPAAEAERYACRLATTAR